MLIYCKIPLVFHGLVYFLKLERTFAQFNSKNHLSQDLLTSNGGSRVEKKESRILHVENFGVLQLSVLFHLKISESLKISLYKQVSWMLGSLCGAFTMLSQSFMIIHHEWSDLKWETLSPGGNRPKMQCRHVEIETLSHHIQEVLRAACGCILLAVEAEIRPGTRRKTAYSTDVSCVSGSTFLFARY